MTFPLLFWVVALALSGYALVESRGKGLVTWAAFLLALGLLWSSLPR